MSASPLFVITIVDLVDSGLASTEACTSILLTALRPEVGFDAPSDTLPRLSRYMDELLAACKAKTTARHEVLTSLSWVFERAAARDFSALAGV